MFVGKTQSENKSISGDTDLVKNISETGSHTIQPKLTVGREDDPLEREADDTADHVMRMSEPDFVQRKCADCEKEENIQRKSFSGAILKKSEGVTSEVSPEVGGEIQSTKGKGSKMDSLTQTFMENRFGTDFSDVNIHTDSDSNKLSKSLNAQAFTVGKDIYFNQSKYHPGSPDGKRLLAHELTHTVQQSDNRIQRVPMPAEDTIQNLETYRATTRQGIRYDIGFNLQTNLSLFFQQGIVMTVRPGYNVTFVVRGFDPAEAWVENAMRALALYNFNLNDGATELPIKNFTTVQHLDLSSQTNPADTTIHGPNANVRFTATSFDATGRGASRTENIQLLVEKVSNFAARTSTETASQRRQRYASVYQITNAVPVRNDPLGDPPETMTDSKFDTVLAALDIVPATVLSRGSGIPIHMGLTALGPNGETAEYNQSRAAGSTTWLRRITAYGDFFTSTLDQQAFIMAHEFGHALDFRPNETATSAGGASLSAQRGTGTFRAALAQDGGLAKGISEYAATKTSQSEYYAEAFSMYINQPETLRALRPHVYDYFHTQYP